MELTTTPTSFSRARGNELKKGYFPTFPSDVKTVIKTLNLVFGWKSRGAEQKIFTILDPCAGEGEFLSAVTRHVKRMYRKTQNPHPHDILSYAVELDASRHDKIVSVTQKLNASFFDVEASGKFSLVLLNPPYNRSGGELVSWVQKSAPLVAHGGLMALIIPEYELKGEMLALLKGAFSFSYCYLSEEYDRFKQVVIFLSNEKENTSETYREKYGNTWYWPASNIEKGERTKFSERHHNNDLNVTGISNRHRPLMTGRDLTELYRECEDRLEKAVDAGLGKLYPSCYDTSIQPLSTLRTAHAVQLAAMNSQIESVTINGEHFLAKFMVTKKVETFKDPESNTETMVHKPTVEAYLMNRNGEVRQAKEYGFDYYDLNSSLSGVLLQKLSKLYQPLHGIGQDEQFLAEELKSIGLKPPQREAVKAVIKAYRNSRKGVGIRANTGTGKTWMAKAIKYLTGARRTVMVSEPQLIPQLAKEYANEGFDVHVIDSWERMKNLAAARPKGLYLIAYTRLRMHPKYETVIQKRKTVVHNNGARSIEFVNICPTCRSPLYEKVRKGDKPKCAACGEPLYTYIPENSRPKLTYGRWIREIEKNGTATRASTHNKQLPYIRLLKKIPFDLAIFDEAHNAANLMSNQGTAFIRLGSSSNKVLALTATVTNGMAKSLYNILWGLNPRQMRDGGWDMKSATDFQTRYGAFKEIRKSEENNRHRESEHVTTHDTAGISPAALIYTLPNFVNVDSDDFDDLPPVEREVIRCAAHPEVEDCQREIAKIINNADLSPQDKLVVTSVRNAAYLRVSDTFRHHDDELRLRGYLLGTLHRRPLEELLEKEERLIEIAQGVVDRGERLLAYTGNTQKIDMRPVLKRLLCNHVEGQPTVEVLPDSVPPERLVDWFEKVTAQIVIASFHRVATGLNLSQFNNLVWFDYTDHTRLAEQGEGRIRRVNTADIHRQVFGEVRPVRYWYLTSSKLQEMQLAYTLEKRMVAKLAEGETPDIDPAECSSGNQSFSALITNALHKGSFDYQDPSALLKKMTAHENGKLKTASAPAPPPARVIPLVKPHPAHMPVTFTVIYREGNAQISREVAAGEYEELLEAGALEVTLFGTYFRSGQPARKMA